MRAWLIGIALSVCVSLPAAAQSLLSPSEFRDAAMAMIVRGFIEPIARELPMEYALELNKLIEMSMEGSVG